MHMALGPVKPTGKLTMCINRISTKRKHTHAHAHAHTHTHTRTHAHAHTHTRTHAHNIKPWRG
jgi:hypothetical protein